MPVVLVWIITRDEQNAFENEEDVKFVGIEQTDFWNFNS